MEYIEIVDEKGEFTGEVMERKMAHDKNLLHNEIAVFIVNSKKQVLLQKRSANKRFSPNKWSLCAGHVLAKESLLSAVVREIKEELGVTLNEGDVKPFGKREIALKPENSHVTYFYYTKLDCKEEYFVIQTEELSTVKWFDIKYVIDWIKKQDSSITLGLERLYLLESLMQT